MADNDTPDSPLEPAKGSSVAAATATSGTPEDVETDSLKVSTLLWALVGVAAAGFGIAVSEIFASLVDGAPSLVTSVGELLIPVTPEPVVEWAKNTFGTDDKPVLNAGTMIITMGVGAVAGVQARTSMARAVPFVAAFAIVGFAAALMNFEPSVFAVLVSVLLTGALVLGVLALARQLGGASPEGADGPMDESRRNLLAVGASTGVAAAGVAAIAGRRMDILQENRGVSVDPLDTSNVVQSAGPVPPASALDIDGITPIIMPNEDFYLIDTALGSPLVDVSDWTLTIGGLVDNPFELSYQDLLDMDHIESYVTLSCVSNSIGGDLVGNAKWRGVRLTDLLDRAGMQDGADEISSTSVDGWFCKFPRETLDDGRDAMVALFMNDELLPRSHGFPARIVVPGLYGFVSATKWLDRIEPTTDFVGYWDTRGWSETGVIKTASRIDVPAAGSSVDQGTVTVAGVSWAVHRGISSIEGRFWQQGQPQDSAEWVAGVVAPPISDDTWVHWKIERDLAPGRWNAQVRAYDGDGNLQPVGPKDPRPDGAEGWDVHPFVVV